MTSNNFRTGRTQTPHFTTVIVDNLNVDEITFISGQSVTGPIGGNTGPTGPNVTGPTGLSMTGSTGSTGHTGPSITGPTGPSITGPTGPNILSPTGPSSLASVSRYLDTVPNGTSANVVFPPIVGNLPLSYIKFWFASSVTGNSTISLRYFRYRTLNGVFTYVQMCDTIVIDSSYLPFVTYYFTNEIRSNITLDEGDTVVISTVYALNGGQNTVQAFITEGGISPTP